MESNRRVVAPEGEGVEARGETEVEETEEAPAEVGTAVGPAAIAAAAPAGMAASPTPCRRVARSEWLGAKSGRGAEDIECVWA